MDEKPTVKTTTTYDLKNFKLYINVLKKDDRFNLDLLSVGNFSTEFHTTNSGFTIRTNKNNMKGNLEPWSFTLPHTEYLDKPLYISFYSDSTRKEYLKNLQLALVDWATKWNGFDKNDKVRFRARENKWYIYTM